MAIGNHMVKHIAGRNILVPFFVSQTHLAFVPIPLLKIEML